MRDDSPTVINGRAYFDEEPSKEWFDRVLAAAAETDVETIQALREQNALRTVYGEEE